MGKGTGIDDDQEKLEAKALQDQQEGSCELNGRKPFAVDRNILHRLAMGAAYVS